MATSDPQGDWRVVRQVLFEERQAPDAVKFAIEKLTMQLLCREPADGLGAQLTYAGTSGAGGHPSTVRLALRAATPECCLYVLTNERTAPRRWEDERAFTRDCDRRFSHWCAMLRVVDDEALWRPLARIPIDDIVRQTIAAEAARDAAREDPAPVAAIQQRVLAGLRAGSRFFTASKEGGSHLTFEGGAYWRRDYGEEPNLSESYDADGMLACLRRFYDWDAQRDTYPHRKTELEVWTFILGQLKPPR